MKLSTMITTTRRLLSGESYLLRHLSTATRTSPPPQKTSENPLKITNWQLYSKLSSTGRTGQKITDVLQELSDKGTQFSDRDLIFCLKKLRQFGRTHNCIEILDWMEKGVIDSSYHALRLDLITRVKGIDEAEKYFDNLPTDMKGPPVYGALLNCYCIGKKTDKALALFEKMREMKDVFNCVAFNNIMGLYINLNQPEKVFPLIQEMKQGNIPLNSMSYLNWIHCNGLLNDLEGLERVVEEIEGQSSIASIWQIWGNIVSAYIKIGECERAAQAIEKMEKVVDDTKDSDRIAYHHLISLYASIGSLESVHRAWGKLKSKFTMCQNLSYTVMLRALLRLDDIEGLKKCFEEWKGRYKSYDVRLPNVVMSAYLKHDMLDEAELLLEDVKHKSRQKLWSSYIIFMHYYLGKRQINLAMGYMDSAIANDWKPQIEKFVPFFEYFKEEKDVDGAEGLLRMLTKVQLPDSRAYLWLLQTYAAAGIIAPNLRQRMANDHVSITTEHEELLERVCPSV